MLGWLLVAETLGETFDGLDLVCDWRLLEELVEEEAVME